MSKEFDKPALLSAYPHITQLPVIWNDMDAMKHVNNTVYFRYLETGRINFLHEFPGPLADPGEQDNSVGIALAETKCRFKVSLTYPDEILIGSAVGEIGEYHFTIVQKIYSKKMDLIASEGESRLVYYDYGKKQKALIEGAILKTLQANQLPQ